MPTPVPAVSLLLSLSLIMPPPFKNLIPYFFGRDGQGKREDPIKFIENVKSTIDIRRHTDEIKRPIATGVIFRLHLKENALLWYQNLSPKIRTDWNRLEAAFLSRFKNSPWKNTDPNQFFNILYNLKQRGRNIVEYIEEGDQLSSECPEKFRDSLGISFIAGLDEGRKINLAQLYLRNKTNVSYAEAKDAVVKAHRRFARPDTFNPIYNCLPPKPSTPCTQSDLVTSSQRHRELRSLQTRDNTPYRPLIVDAKSQNQTGRIQVPHGINCHDSWEEGHDYTSCTKPIVSSAQREASRLAINGLREAPRQYPLSLNQEHQYPQSFNQAHQYPQSVNQAHRYPSASVAVAQAPVSRDSHFGRRTLG